MRAAVCRGFGEPLRVEELELAPPGPGQVAVRIDAVAICQSTLQRRPAPGAARCRACSATRRRGR